MANDPRDGHLSASETFTLVSKLTDVAVSLVIASEALTRGDLNAAATANHHATVKLHKMIDAMSVVADRFATEGVR